MRFDAVLSEQPNFGDAIRGIGAVVAPAAQLSGTGTVSGITQSLQPGGSIYNPGPLMYRRSPAMRPTPRPAQPIPAPRPQVIFGTGAVAVAPPLIAGEGFVRRPLAEILHDDEMFLEAWLLRPPPTGRNARSVQIIFSL